MALFRSIECYFRKKGYNIIAGLDEAGRGPWAGPVIGAAVIIPFRHMRIKDLNDSKKLSSIKRTKVYDFVKNKTIFGIGIGTNAEIDQFGLIKTTFLAFQRALENLASCPDFLLIDGSDNFEFSIPSRSFIKGDEYIRSISCASIMAKVTRDKLMMEYAEQFPYYEFQRNKGYGTYAHLTALKKRGICALHRTSFKPIKKIVQEQKVSSIKDIASL